MNILTNTFDSFGLDIGDRSLKLTYIKRKGSHNKIVSFGTIGVPKGVFDKGALIKPDILTDHFRRLLESSKPNKIKTKYVHACLPETHTFIKLLTLEVKEVQNLETRIKEELPRHIPLNLEEIYIDWNLIKSKHQGIVQVLVGAIPKKTSDTYTTSLRKCGLTPVSLQIEAQAISRCLLANNEPEQKPTAIVDIGATRSSLIMHDKGNIQFSISLPIASESITKEISEKLKLSFEDAQKEKHTKGIDSKNGNSALSNTINPLIKELSDSIQKSNIFYQEHFPGAKAIDSLMLCGGGSLLHGLHEKLQSSLPNIKIIKANPLLHIHNNKKFNLDVSYTTALGLGLSNTY